MEQIIRPTGLAWLFAAGSLALVPCAAHAQSASLSIFGTTSMAKTEAILGGAPSRLAAIMAEQQGLVPANPARVQPAAYALPRPAPAAVRNASWVSPGAASGRPDIFGSVALAVGRTPLDQRWNRVERSHVTGRPAAYAVSLRGLDELERIEAVNRYVNRQVRFVDDSRQFGHEDVWSPASETLRRGRGDCEDYAIAKFQMLRSAGLSEGDLYLVVLKDLVRRSDHAVLVVRAGTRMLVLDNGTDALLDSESVQDYRPILTFAAHGAWTHGYRRTMPPVTIASADIGTRFSPVAPAGDQRSRSASLLAFNTGFSR